MNKKRLITIGLVAGVFLTSMSTASAAVVGHWRFEDAPGFLADSSGNGLALASASGYVTQVALPSAGAGQYFDDPIPLSGAGNAAAAGFDGSDWLTLGDQPELSLGALTVEAYINRSAGDTRHVIAGQYNGTDNQRSWALLVSEENDLWMLLTPDGADYGSIHHRSHLPIRPGVDYYVAASYDPADLESGVQFYVKNLETGVWLQSSSALHFEPPLHDSTANLNIGGYGDGARLFEGLIDEVRISDTALSDSELLAGPVDDSSRTIGHWRFEDDPGFLGDSSGNGFALENHGATQATLPAVGAGGLFDDPLPQTAQSNAGAAGFDGTGWLSRPDETEFSVDAFTIEAYIHENASGARHLIASQYDSVDNQRSWAFFVESGELRMFLCENGTNLEIVPSGIQIDPNVDYFVAASFDPAGDVNFYVKDLLSDTWSESSKGHVVPFVLDSTANFNIGSYADGARLFDGLIDEVRWSHGILAKDELLASLREGTLAGDLDGDGFVGSSDLDIVRAHWGDTVTAGDLAMGDPSGDGMVGSADLDVVRANWGLSLPAAVPEPGGLLLLSIGLIGIVLRRIK